MEKQASTPTWARKCDICGKEVVYETYRELLDDYEDDKYYCNDECRKKGDKKEREIRIASVIEREIPKKFREIETDKVDILDRHFRKSLFISGGVGAGKTVFACSYLKRAAREKPYLPELRDCPVHDHSIQFISYPKFIMKLQSAFRDDSVNPESIASEVASSRAIICIDDLGAEKLTEYVKQITYYIINEREQNELPILITSNFSLDQIDKMIDPRVSSRISGMCEILRFSGKDRRTDK